MTIFDSPDIMETIKQHQYKQVNVVELRFYHHELLATPWKN